MPTEEQTAGTSDGGLYGAPGVNRAAQRLTIPGRTVSKLSFKLAKFGNPTGTLYFRIRKVSNDSLIASKGMDVSTLPIKPNYAWPELTFDAAAFANEQVRICVEYTGGNSVNCAVFIYSSSDVKASENFWQYVSSWVDKAPKDLAYIYTYETISSPTATTGPASSVGTAIATLNGTLADDGGEACNCGFEYGLDTGYGTTTPTQSKETGESFSQALTGLSPNTTYHFRAIATNSAGTSYGSDATFTTEVDMAEVTTDPASSVEATKATLNSTLDDDGGESCSVRFQYGETTDYGTNTDWQTGKTTGDTFEQALVGLLPGRVYHFRAQAKNSAGTISGEDRVFHTEALPAEAFKALKRSYPLGRAEI